MCAGTGAAQTRAPCPPLAGLLIAVSASVDKIISHFGAARNLVQKVRVPLGRPWGRTNGGRGGGRRRLGHVRCVAPRPSWGIAG